MWTRRCTLVCNELLEPFGMLNEPLQLNEAQVTTPRKTHVVVVVVCVCLCVFVLVCVCS